MLVDLKICQILHSYYLKDIHAITINVKFYLEKLNVLHEVLKRTKAFNQFYEIRLTIMFQYHCTGIEMLFSK